MINLKPLTFEELEKDYFDRLGFVFCANSKIDINGIEKIASKIIAEGITEEWPEFVSCINDNMTAFVYKTFFHMPSFMMKSQAANQFNQFYTTSIRNFVTEYKNEQAKNNN